MSELLTIGELAKQAGLRTSALRYYEEQGLLQPAQRTAAGYRLYDPEAEHTLLFIQRAQRLGFSLTDIGKLLRGFAAATLSEETVTAIAERRFIELEQELTDLQVQRHELEMFLLDFREQVSDDAPDPALSLFDRLIERVCSSPATPHRAQSTLDWLVERTGCGLSEPDASRAIEALRGRHVHVWKEHDAYHILIVSNEPAVHAALETLVMLEDNCNVHTTPHLEDHPEGKLFIARGENAFIYTQLFLAIE